MRNYRRIHPRSPAKPTLASMLAMAKNNLAIDLGMYTAKILVITSSEQVKNMLATAQLILVQRLTLQE